MGIEDRLAAALALHRAGRTAEAEAIYAAILDSDPKNADALHLLGIVRAQTGRVAEAIALLAKAVEAVPRSSLYRINLIKALALKGRWEAVACVFREGGDVCLDDGRPEEAVVWYRKAAAVAPDDVTSWFNLAVAARDVARLAEAARGFIRAARLDSSLKRARFETAMTLAALDRHGEAMIWLGALLEEDGDNADVRVAFGNAAKSVGDSAKAEELYRQAIAIRPDLAVAWFNLGVALADSDRNEPAAKAYRVTCALSHDNASAHYNLAHQLLLLGRWSEGWTEFEWRFRVGVDFPERGRPRWQGEPLAGRTILLYGEQGHGDTLQFIRYAPLVAERGGRVVVECPSALVRLLSGVDGVSAVHPLGTATEFDLICPLLSLPRIFTTTVDTVPAQIPYLSAKVADGRRFDRFFADDGRLFRVGLVWAGEPRPESRRWSLANRRRSIPLAGFARLLDVPGTRFFSLQLGEAAEQAAKEPFLGRIIDPMGEVGDFADTAAIVCRLDLVISVDTSVAHLAGGLGVPVWLLSRFDGCWRWLAGRDDSPWYPGMRVFRQPAIERWEPVLESLAALLPEIVRDRISSRRP